MVGDLANGRTVRSLAYLLAKYSNMRIIFASPPDLAMKPDILDYLKRKGVRFTEVDLLEPALPETDVLYCTRIQKERGSAMDEAAESEFSLTPDKVATMKRTACIMHPLPRNHEIAAGIDNDPRAIYFKQAGNGMFIRMALLLWVMNRHIVFA